MTGTVSSKRRALPGFTLVEVMIALMVFGLLAATLQQVATGYMGNYRRIESQIMATWIARNRLAAMRLEDELPGTGNSDDEVEYGSHDWAIETSVSNTDDPGMRRVEMTFYRIEEPGSRRLKQLVYTGFLGQD